MHLVLVLASYTLAFLLRFDRMIPTAFRSIFVITLGPLLIFRLGAFAFYRLYSGWWRYVGMRDMVALDQGDRHQQRAVHGVARLHRTSLPVPALGDRDRRGADAALHRRRPVHAARGAREPASEGRRPAPQARADHRRRRRGRVVAARDAQQPGPGLRAGRLRGRRRPENRILHPRRAGARHHRVVRHAARDASGGRADHRDPLGRARADPDDRQSLPGDARAVQDSAGDRGVVRPRADEPGASGTRGRPARPRSGGFGFRRRAGGDRGPPRAHHRSGRLDRRGAGAADRDLRSRVAHAPGTLGERALPHRAGAQAQASGLGRASCDLRHSARHPMSRGSSARCARRSSITPPHSSTCR